MLLARKLAYNVVFNSALKVISTVAIALFSIRLITGYLGKEGFGDYATILAFFALFAAVTDLGIASVTAREISRKGSKESDILGKVAGLRLISAGAMVLLSPAVFFVFEYPRHVEIGIWITSVAVVFSSFSLFLNGIFQKNVAMDRVAMVEFIGKLVQLGIVVLATTLDLGFLAIAGALVVALGFNALSAYILSRAFVRFRIEFDWEYSRTFLRESLPLGLSAVVTFLYFKLDTILLSVIQGSAAVGTYGVAYKVMENLTFFPAMLAGLILPLLSRTVFTDRAEFKRIADTTFRVFFILAAPILVGILFLAPQVIAIVSGEGFEDAVPVLRILAVSLFFVFFGHFFNTILIVGNLQKRLLVALVFVALVNVIANSILISIFSFMGAAVTSAATECLVALVTGLMVSHFLGYRPSARKFFGVAVSTSAMAAALWAVSGMSIVVSLLVAPIVYLSGLWLTRAVSTSEIASIFLRKDAGTRGLGEDVV